MIFKISIIVKLFTKFRSDFENQLFDLRIANRIVSKELTAQFLMYDANLTILNYADYSYYAMAEISGTTYLVSDSFHLSRKREREKESKFWLWLNGVSGMQLRRGLCNACVNDKVRRA